VILGVDGRSRRDTDADHLAHVVREVVRHHLGDEVAHGAVLATHQVRLGQAHTAVSCVLRATPDPRAAGGGPRVDSEAPVEALVEAVAALLPASGAVAATGPGLPDGVVRGTDTVALAGAWVAVAAAATGTTGRLVHFPGQEVLTGRLTVAELLAGSAIDEVVVVGGSAHTPATVVDTRGFLRPQLRSGRVRLLVQPAVGGVVVPFERANPHRCCGDH